MTWLLPVHEILGNRRSRSLSGVKVDGNSLVRLVYLDESGISIRETFCVVTGVLIDTDRQWKPVEKYVNGLIKKYVHEKDRREFVFHATELFRGSGKVFGDRSKYPLQRSHEALRKLLTIPSRFRLPVVFGVARKKPIPENATSAIRRVEASRNYGNAFSLCVVAAEKYMRQSAKPSELARLVAENNTDARKLAERIHLILQGRVESDLIRLLSKIAPHCLPITKIVDSVHFAGKNDAVLLQIADACAFTIRCFCERKANVKEFVDALTQNRPDSLRIGTGQRGGYSILNFGNICLTTRIRESFRVIRRETQSGPTLNG